MTISGCFEKIIAKQRAIGYHFPLMLRAPATNQQLTDVERSLGFRFNHELVELYSFADGTNMDEKTPLGKAALIPIYTFLNLADATQQYHARIGVQDYFLNVDNNFRPRKKLFPFLDDHAGNCYWVDLNGDQNHGRIYWTNTFGENPDYLFSSLSSFFHVILKCYEVDVFFLEGEYLECDDELMAEIAKELDPAIPYWTKFLEDAD